MPRFCLSLVWVLAGATMPSTARGADTDTARQRMVDELVTDEPLRNARVLEAMRETPRHEFVPSASRSMAYHDMALPIGRGQTISPPSLVAGMIDALDPQPNDRVLEIGTGTGYQAAVLSRLVAEVYTIEIVKSLARKARATLKRLDRRNVHVKRGDGFSGWPEHAPFDKIVVACSPEQVPRPLLEQLREGGRMIIPLGDTYHQMLYLLVKKEGQLVRKAIAPTVFVPMTGRAEAERQETPGSGRVALVNGSFEATEGERPIGWYHQRQLILERNPNAPHGRQFVTFQNASPGRTAEASQAFAVDGRATQVLVISGMVKGTGLAQGAGEYDRAAMVVAFYSAARETIGLVSSGDWHGTFDWREFSESVPVPPEAREAILRLGLYGATGSLSVDCLRLDEGP